MPEPSQRPGSSLMLRNSLCQSLVVLPWKRSLTLIPHLTVIRVAGSRLSTDTTDSRKKGNLGALVTDVLQFTTSPLSSLPVLQDGTLPKFVDQWISITSSWFVLNTVNGHHLRLRCYHPLFCYFRWFNIMAAPAHHPIIQKGVQ